MYLHFFSLLRLRQTYLRKCQRVSMYITDFRRKFYDPSYRASSSDGSAFMNLIIMDETETERISMYLSYFLLIN